MTKLKLHPVAELFPKLTEDEYSALRKSIREHGVLVPIIADEKGRIVDGRHRAEIAEELGISYTTKPLPRRTTAWQYAAEVNLARRNLDKERRVALLLLAEEAGQAPEVTAIRKEARKRQGDKSALETPVSQVRAPQSSDRIGALVDAAGSTVRKVQTAAKVRKTALRDIADGKATAGAVIREANKKVSRTVEAARGTPKALDKWREVRRIIDTHISAGSISGYEATAREIDLVRDATPRLIDALEAFRDEIVRPSGEIRVLQGGKRR